MKKYISLFLALILLVSAVSVFTVTANAEEEQVSKSYDLYKTSTAPIVDGTAEEFWDDYSWSDNFYWRWASANYSNSNLVANFKAVWMENSTDPSKMDLYVLVQYTGYYDYPSISGVRFYLINVDGTV